MIGKSYNQLTVIKKNGFKLVGTRKRKEILWQCKCTCGNIVDVTAYKLKTNHTKSCGCVKRLYVKGLIQNNRKNMKLLARNALLSNYKKGAKIRSLSWGITDDFAWNLMHQKCYYCGTMAGNEFFRQRANYRSDQAKDSYCYNGIDRLDSLKGYVVNNVVSCCSICNYAKRDLSLQDFVIWLKRVTENLPSLVDNLNNHESIYVKP